MSDRWPVPTPPGWFPDPGGTPTLRFWNGVRWTDSVAVPMAPTRPAAADFTPLPFSAAITTLVVTLVSLTASKFLVEWLVDYRWPLVAYIVIAGVAAYGPLVVCCAYVVRRWGTNSVRNDLGLRFRAIDLGWGPVTWIACFVAQITVAVIVLTLHIPIVSNTEGISKLSADHAYVIAFAILAVGAAPIIEELVFRGIVLRGFRSRLPTWLSVGLQGILFGCAHIDPTRGKGNIGLVMVLSAVGVVLGGAAYLLRRLAPTMISHALTNTLALVLILSR